ncbi:MAG: hypothetical protein JW841_18415 [Deltaproteobacteria bacterium]|nr:hypothetical protein [Deltaproteobacteria bacterium]
MKLSAFIVLAAGFCAASPVLATDLGNCEDQPNPIYVSGSSAIGNFIGNLTKPMKDQGYTLVYSKKGSCDGVNAIVSGVKLTGTLTVYDDDAKPTNTCTVATDGGVAVDIGVSDVYAKTCLNADPPSTVGDFFGPIQAMLIVVPEASTQQAITWEQVHMLFGYGAAAEVESFTDNNLIYHRNDKSGTQQMVSYASDLPASKWLTGTDNNGPFDAGGSSGVRDSVGSSTSPNAIGILGAEVYDLARDKLNSLAFKGKNQLFAFYADSTPTATDKKNVRDGHYQIWGPLHLLAQVGSNGQPTNEKAKLFIDVVSGEQSLEGANILDTAITSGVVPSCAMTVQRSAEVGPISPYTPDEPCACYFEKNAGGSTSCATCSGADGTACSGGGICRRGYCEAN